MRSATAAINSAFTALAVTLVLLLVPTAAFAVDGAPDEMVDPVAAVEPEIDVATPVDGVAEVAGAPGPAQGDAVQEATQGAVDGDVSTPAYSAPGGSGSLPFTGPDPGLLMLLFLVGSLALTAGIVAFSYARVVSETA